MEYIFQQNKMKKIAKVWTTDNEIWIKTDQGEEAFETFSDYPRFKYATKAQREAYITDDIGIHWTEIDEDLSFEGFFNKKTPTQLYDLFIKHPELNASAIARRMDISQSLFAQYISGIKKPSDERLAEIITTINNIGKELAEIKIHK